MPYQAWMFLHQLGVIVFFANLVAALFWRSRAEQTNDPRILAFAYRTLNLGDARLTPASVGLIVASGVGAALQVRLPILSTGWILWSIVLFSVSGLLFGLRVLPCQKALAVHAEAGVRDGGGFDLATHRRLAREWAFWAHLSLLAAAAVLPMMVFRPGIPGM